MSVDFDALVLAPVAAAFGTPVYYYTATTGPIGPLSGVFNDRYTEIKFQDGIQVVETSIVLGIRAALFAVQPVRNEWFRIKGILYRIQEPPEPDGMGDLKITLAAATNADAALMRAPGA